MVFVLGKIPAKVSCLIFQLVELSFLEILFFGVERFSCANSTAVKFGGKCWDMGARGTCKRYGDKGTCDSVHMDVCVMSV